MLTLQVKEKEIENLTPNKEFVRGTVGAICQVNFDEFWQDYEKWVVFKRSGCEPIKVMVNSLTNEVEIDPIILAESGEFQVGVFGVIETKTLPTLYSDFIKIRYGTDTNATTPPKYTPSEIDQLRLSKQDKLTAGTGIKISEDNVISATGGGGTGGGTTDYEELDNKPKINGVELVGNKSTSDLGIEIPTVDQDFESTSENAQSGVAITQIFMPLDQRVSDLNNYVISIDNKLASDYVTNAYFSQSFGSLDQKATDAYNYAVGVSMSLKNYYTKTDIDGMVGDIETLLGGI